MLKNYLSRVSIRDFDGTKVTQEEIKIITDVINNAPTSTNSQQFSAIIITDQEKLDYIGKNNWGQTWVSNAAGYILFFADQTILEEVNKGLVPNPDFLHNEFMRAVVDATIGLTYTHDALIEMGFGTVIMGGVYIFADDIHRKFKVPDSAMLVGGLAFGKTTQKNEFKPKMNKVHMNIYSKEKALEELQAYNKVLAEYFIKRRSKRTFIKNNREMLTPGSAYVEAFSKAGKYFGARQKRMMKK